MSNSRLDINTCNKVRDGIDRKLTEGFHFLNCILKELDRVGVFSFNYQSFIRAKSQRKNYWKMYIKRYGLFFNGQHVMSTIGILAVLIILVTRCNACPRRTPTPRPTTKPKTTRSDIESSSKIVSATSRTPLTTQSGTSQPDKSFDFCYSTTIENLTRENIESTMRKLAEAGNLTYLFSSGTKGLTLFLKEMKPNDTGCSNIKGYIINVTNGVDYDFDIRDLNKTLAEKNCEDFQGSCSRFKSELAVFSSPNATEISVESNETMQTTKQETTETTKQKNSSEQPIGGTTVAAKSKDKSAGISATTIGIPVALVFVLVIVVIILVCWFKRRSTRKCNKNDLTQNSANHMAGPLNGDVYTMVNPNTEKEKNGKDDNDIVYTELSHIKSNSEKSVKEHPESDQKEYADITHILRAGETAYENVALHNGDKDTYVNVVEVQ